MINIKVSWTSVTITVPSNSTINTVEMTYLKKLRIANTYGCSIRHLPEVLAIFRSDFDLTTASPLVKQVYQNEMKRRSMPEDIFTCATFNIDKEAANQYVLWEHQLRGVLLARYNSRYAFYYDTRTGKTRMAYTIMQEALKEKRVRRCLVVVPSSIIPDWLSDAAAVQCIHSFSVGAFYKNEKQRQEVINTNPDIWLVSTEQIVKHYADLPKDFDLCFFDESSKLKSHKTQISKFMLDFSQTVQYMYLLSATPAPNGEHEYYTQMRCLDPYIFPASREQFKRDYFVDYSRDNKYEKLQIIPERKAAFMSKINEYAYYVDQKVMPVAKKFYYPIKYKLPDSIWPVYDKMRKDCSAMIDGVPLTVKMVATVRLKLQQITSGFIIDTEAQVDNMIVKVLHLQDELKQEVLPLKAAKDARLLVLYSIIIKHLKLNSAEKFVIWANYHEEFKHLEECMTQCNLSYGILNGSVSIQEKEDTIKEFKAGNIQVLLAHPLSVGMGKNFTESHIAIYYSINDSWEAFKQSSERIFGHIAVQPNDCLYYIIIAENTIDEVVWNNVSNKRAQSTGILEHLSKGGDKNGKCKLCR